MTKAERERVEKMKDRIEQGCEYDISPFSDRDFLLSLISKQEKMLRAAMDGVGEFVLNHEHSPGLSHTRALGDSYGWCDHCGEKVSWGEYRAKELLSQLAEIGGEK